MKTSVGNTEMFDIKTGVRQCCSLSPPFLFLITIDFVMTKAMDVASFGTEWGQKRLADLGFADDMSAISHTLAGIQEITNNIETFGAKIRLREDQGHEDRALVAYSHLRREVLISWKLCQATATQYRMYAPGSEKLHPFSIGFVL